MQPLESQVDYVAVERTVLRFITESRYNFSQSYSLFQTYQWADPYCRFFFKVALQAWSRNGEVPSREVYVEAVRHLPTSSQKPAIGALAAILGRSSPDSPLSLIELLRQRGIRDSAIDAHYRAAQFLERGEGEKAVEVMQQAGAGSRVVRKAEKLLAGGWRPEVLKRRTPTGLYLLDLVIGGLGDDDLTFISGPKGMGKSTLVIQIIKSSIIHEEPVLLLDSENKQPLVKARTIASFTGIPTNSLREPGLLTREEESFLDAWTLRVDESIGEFLRVVPIGIGETSFADVQAIIMQCIAEGFRPKRVVIDTPSHFKADGFRRKNDSNQYAWFEPLTLALRGQIVDRFKCGVVATWQLNEKGKLFGSSEMEKTAQTWLDMEVADDPKTKKPSAVGHRLIHIRKNREGNANISVPVMADLACSRMSAYPDDESDAGALLENS